MSTKAKESEAKKGCEYCCNGGVGGWKTLFRIIDTYPCGDKVEFYECEICDRGIETVCGECEHAPYQPVNALNITVGVVGNRLMFEDKGKVGRDDYKRYHDINYCPMCGRSLGKEGHING